MLPAKAIVGLSGVGAVVLCSTMLSAMPPYPKGFGNGGDETSQPDKTVSATLYASPSGTSNGTGSRNDPVDLSTGLSRVSPDTVLELLGGVYRIPNGSIVYMGGRGSGKNTIRAASGERPIITRENGFPPYIYVQNNTRVEGIWFGGAVDSVNTPFNVSNDDEIVGCVFWGYCGCIGDASRHNLYENNLFVNCGREPLYHPIYITGQSTSWDSCTIIRRNVFIGGEGWAMHLWHGPTYVRVENNFVGNAKHCLASDGFPVIARDNIFWSNTTLPTILIRGDMTLTHNLIGKAHTYYEYRDPAAISVVADQNSFIEPASPGGPFGTNHDQWEEIETATHLTLPAPTIDSAIQSIQGLFANATTSIFSDNTFNDNIAVLFTTLDGWAALVPKAGITPMPRLLPEECTLSQNYPNPFNPSTTIEFSLPSAAYTTLRIFTIVGTEVATLVSEDLRAGDYSKTWNAANLPSGSYVFRLQSGIYSKSERSVLLK